MQSLYLIIAFLFLISIVCCGQERAQTPHPIQVFLFIAGLGSKNLAAFPPKRSGRERRILNFCVSGKITSSVTQSFGAFPITLSPSTFSGQRPRFLDTSTTGTVPSKARGCKYTEFFRCSSGRSVSFHSYNTIAYSYHFFFVAKHLA